MKKIILLSIVLFFTTLIYAQCPNAGDNIYYPQLNKFEGTWKYSNGNTEVILILKKKHITTNIADSESYQIDKILGVLSVKVNNITVYSNLNDLNSLINDNNYRCRFVFKKECDMNNDDLIYCYSHDDIKQKSITIYVTYQHTNTPSIHLRQSNNERFGLINLDGTVISEDLSNPNGTFDPTFTIPNNIVLIKQP
ncbi:DUF6705 family protein [Ferruginibacter yonginensis]|uniref:DUF6705 family protein n=1 Tax=Ferruginibacter yonginensis TaxID=1310416 RepID=A0ABV8QSY1_9BACT